MSTATLERQGQQRELSELEEFLEDHLEPQVLELFDRLEVVETAEIGEPPIESYRLHVDSNVEIANVHLDEAPGGSFKARGAFYAMQKEYKNGIRFFVTASAGNHAQGVAHATRILNEQAALDGTEPVRSEIDMPEKTPRVKIQGVERLGGGDGQITTDLSATSFEHAQNNAIQKAKKDPETIKFLSAFNNYNVIAGQGTAVLRTLLDNPNADELHLGVGGGGLLAGTLEVVAALKREGLINPNLKVVAIMLQGNDSLAQTRENNWVPTSATAVDTFTEGSAVQQIGDIPAAIIQRYAEHLEIEFVTKEDMARELCAIEDRNYQRQLAGEEVYPIPETTTLAILTGTSKRAMRHDKSSSEPVQYLTLSTGRNADPKKLHELYAIGDNLLSYQEMYDRKMVDRVALGRQCLAAGGLVGAA